MKAKILAIVMVMLLTLGLCGVAAAQQTADITINIVAPAESILSFDLNPETWSPGESAVELNTIYTSEPFALKNTGGVAFEADIRGTDAGGADADWELSENFTNGNMTYGLAFREIPFGDANPIPEDTVAALATVNPGIQFDFNLKLKTPTSITNYSDTLTATVTITMVAQ